MACMSVQVLVRSNYWTMQQLAGSCVHLSLLAPRSAANQGCGQHSKQAHAHNLTARRMRFMLGSQQTSKTLHSDTARTTDTLLHGLV